MKHDARIPPLNDPQPFTPTVEKIDTTNLPAYAKTAEEYWQIVDCIWPAILDIFERVGLKSEDIDKAKAMKEARDIKLPELFNRAWIMAPDAYFIHTWPQWGRFCDLCSECHVLYPEEQ